MWESERDTPAAHLVPAEIALKIEAKVRARQRFTAYVVVPMCVACVRVRAASHVRVPAVLRARCLCALSRAQRAADKFLLEIHPSIDPKVWVRRGAK